MLKAKIPTTEAAILAGLQQYGPTPAGKKLLDAERAAAIWAIESGLYAVYRSVPTGRECTRIGPATKCFCGHTCSEHDLRNPMVRCVKCPCKAFAYVPIRPEEIGEWWLPRRKDFDIRTWFPKCRCGHGPASHLPDGSRRCVACKCGAFNSNFLCLNCDKHWEEHESAFETEQDRKRAGRLVGQAYMPLHDQPEMAEIVFGGPGGGVKAPEDDAQAEYQKLLKRSRSPAATRPLLTSGIERLSLGAGGSRLTEIDDEGPAPGASPGPHLHPQPLAVTPTAAVLSRRPSGSPAAAAEAAPRRASVATPPDAARLAPAAARRPSVSASPTPESRRASVRPLSGGGAGASPARRLSAASASPHTPAGAGAGRLAGAASPRDEEHEERDGRASPPAPLLAYTSPSPPSASAGPSRRASAASAAPSRNASIAPSMLHSAAAAAAAARAGSIGGASRKASIRLDQFCHQCGAGYTPTAKFCSQCGQRRAYT
eukprot:tig00000857_g4928.t1